MSHILDITESVFNKLPLEKQKLILAALYQFCTGNTTEPRGNVKPCFKLMTSLTDAYDPKKFRAPIAGMFYRYNNLAISVQFGAGNYGSNYDGGVPLEQIETFEIAFVKFYEDGTSSGLISINYDEVAGYIHRRNIKALIDKVLYRDYGAKSLREISLRLARAVIGIEGAKDPVKLRKRE